MWEWGDQDGKKDGQPGQVGDGEEGRRDNAVVTPHTPPSHCDWINKFIGKLVWLCLPPVVENDSRHLWSLVWSHSRHSFSSARISISLCLLIIHVTEYNCDEIPLSLSLSPCHLWYYLAWQIVSQSHWWPHTIPASDGLHSVTMSSLISPFVTSTHSATIDIPTSHTNNSCSLLFLNNE